jgi:hypothetical protein
VDLKQASSPESARLPPPSRRCRLVQCETDPVADASPATECGHEACRRTPGRLRGIRVASPAPHAADM